MNIAHTRNNLTTELTTRGSNASSGRINRIIVTNQTLGFCTRCIVSGKAGGLLVPREIFALPQLPGSCRRLGSFDNRAGCVSLAIHIFGNATPNPLRSLYTQLQPI